MLVAISSVVYGRTAKTPFCGKKKRVVGGWGICTSWRLSDTRLRILFER
jgi:hypothetical protein